jgi:hypothetical protein
LDDLQREKKFPEIVCQSNAMASKSSSAKRNFAKWSWSEQRKMASLMGCCFKNYPDDCPPRCDCERAQMLKQKRKEEEEKAEEEERQNAECDSCSEPFNKDSMTGPYEYGRKRNRARCKWETNPRVSALEKEVDNLVSNAIATTESFDEAQQDIETLKERVEEAESTIQDLKETIKKLQEQMAALMTTKQGAEE